LPNRIRCPHCRSRVRYAGIGGVIAFLIVLFIVLSSTAFALAQMIIPGSLSFEHIAVFAALLVAAWTPIELATALFLRRRRRLRGAG
jgi:uncharacterized membrane protein